MNKIIFLIMLLCNMGFTLVAQNNKTLTRFEGQKIKGLDASNSWNIEISQGVATLATVTFPGRFEKNIVFELNEEGILKLGIRGKMEMRQGEKLTAVVVCSSLDEVDLSGACKLNGNGEFRTDKMDFDLSGASQVVISGALKSATSLKIELSGASKALLSAESAQAAIDVSGASHLTLKGKAESAKIEVSGAARVEMEEYAIHMATVDLSGASNLSLNVSGVIVGEISGASQLLYMGEATTRLDVSGASKLKHK